MSCKKPLKAFPIGLTEKGKVDYKICSYAARGVYNNGSSWVAYDHRPGVGYKIVTDFIEIPCGQCLGCRLDHAAEWANRCMVEAEQYDSNYFITLTYDDDHLHHQAYGDENGEAVLNSVLWKKDLQDFWKRLRKATGQMIRYYACGEYGDTTFRPHYHAIVFNLQLDDLERFGGSPAMPTFTSKFLSKIWKHGHVLVANVCYETCAYVARYVVKKSTGKLADFYDYYNLTPEFVVMSRKPGIARNFYDKSLFEDDFITFATKRKGIKFKPPRYYKKLLEAEDPQAYKEVSERNKLQGEMMKAAKLAESSYSYLEMLSIEERQMSKILNLRRSKV